MAVSGLQSSTRPRRLAHLHIGMLVRKMTTWIEAMMTIVHLIPIPVVTQSNAKKVRTKLKKFLKMIIMVNPSIARSPREKGRKENRVSDLIRQSSKQG